MRKAIILFVGALSLYADWCIVHATQRAIHDNEDKLFFKNFPRGVISKKGKFFRFESGPYATKEEAKRVLKKARKFNPDAFLRKCSILIGERSVKKKSLPIPKVQKTRHSSQKRQIASKEPEGIDLEKVVLKLEKKPAIEYEELGFYDYLDRLLKNDFQARALTYKERLAHLEALIENSVYDWDIFANVMVRYSRFIDYDLATNKELTLDAGIGINKRLFDSGVLIKDRLIALKERLAKLESLSQKDKLSIYGLAIYAQALLDQKTKELYEESYYNQKAFYRLIQERKKAGLASRVDEIDAKNDLLNIKKGLLQKIYNYLYSDFLLRSSAEINSTKPLKLKEFGLEPRTLQSSKLFESALANNLAIKRERSLLTLKRAYQTKTQNAFLPIVDFNSALFYEYKKDFAQNPTTSANGLNYFATLNFKFPLYSQSNRSYLLQKAKVDTLLQRYRLLDTIKKTSQEIMRYSNELRRLREQLRIVEQQLELMQEKQKLVRKRYVSGLSTYRQYSDAIRSYLALVEEKVGLEIGILQDSAMLKILEGGSIFYGED